MLDFHVMLCDHLNQPVEQQSQIDVPAWFNNALNSIPQPQYRKKRNASTTFSLLPSEFQFWCNQIKSTYGYSTYFDTYGEPQLKIKDNTLKDIIGHQMFDSILSTTGKYYQVCVFQKDPNTPCDAQKQQTKG